LIATMALALSGCVSRPAAYRAQSMQKQRAKSITDVVRIADMFVAAQLWTQADDTRV
jgi:starvation-inducible outer membrane lipoprotein